MWQLDLSMYGCVSRVNATPSIASSAVTMALFLRALYIMYITNVCILAFNQKHSGSTELRSQLDILRFEK